MMYSSVDKRIYLIALLSVIAVVITIIRERHAVQGTRQEIRSEFRTATPANVAVVIDTTLQMLGITKEKIRIRKITSATSAPRLERRIEVPKEFEITKLLTVLKDSLQSYNVAVSSTENLKERSTIVYLSYQQAVLHSIVITRKVQQKGASPSVPKKQIRRQ